MSEAIRLTELQEQTVELAPEDCRFLLGAEKRIVEVRSAVAEGYWKLWAAGTCGAVPLPSGRVIYIEPKVGIANLWHMLTYAYDLLELRREAVGLGTAEDLVESVVEVFSKQVEGLIEFGLLRSYVEHEENLLAMRGRLNVVEQVRRNLVARHRLACRYDEFTTDVAENRILRYTLFRLLRARLWRARVRQRVDRCERRMDEARLEHIEERHFGELRFTRLNERYRTPLALAGLLLQMLSLTHRPGEHRQEPLLLDMPRVFERFLQRALEERLKERGLRVRWPNSNRWLAEEKRVPLKPDMVIERGGAPVCIVDAKYKGRADDEEARAADVYQMLAYCVGYRVGNAVLVYPQAVRDEALRVRRSGVDVAIHTVGVDLTRGNGEGFEAALGGLADGVEQIAEAAIAEGGGEARALVRAVVGR